MDDMYIDHDGGAYNISIASQSTIEELILGYSDLIKQNDDDIKSLEEDVHLLEIKTLSVEEQLTDKEDRYLKESTNLFHAETLDDSYCFHWFPESNNLFVGSNSSYEESTVTFSEVCPDAKLGETYTGNYESNGQMYLVVDYSEIDFCSTFTVTEEILGSHFRFWLERVWIEEENNEFPVSTDFYDISLNKGYSVLPYEPAGNLNLSQTLDKITEDIDNLAPVAKTGSYNDLLNKPIIPSESSILSKAQKYTDDAIA